MKLIQSLDTHGARAAETFVHDGRRYLVIPQLAMDVPGQPAKITVGDSDIDALVFVWVDGRFVAHGSLPVPGGEDAEYFRIGEREFLATASLRMGAGPYDLNCNSTIFELMHGQFTPFQSFPTFAAKQWTFFEAGGRPFLALAQGAVMEGSQPRHPAKSVICEWDGTRFQPFQHIDSAAWGYNFAKFDIDGQEFLAYADNVAAAQIYRWTGSSFEPFQTLEGKTSRAFAFFRAEGQAWLAFACLHDDTVLLRWDGQRFVKHQVLSGPGGREFHWIAGDGEQGGKLVVVNFILGTRDAPIPKMNSAIYRFEAERLVLETEFPTSGATDAAVFEEGGHAYMVVSNSLSADVRFATQSCVYRLD
jgi:hypothetical protein